MKEDGEVTFELNSGWRKHETDLRTTTIGDSVFKKSPRPFHNIRQDAMEEVKLRTWSRNYIGAKKDRRIGAWTHWNMRNKREVNTVGKMWNRWDKRIGILVCESP
jgi:hypothetical protein